MYETKEERDALFSLTGKYTEKDLLNKEATGFGWAVLVQDNFENNRLKVIKLPNRESTTRELLVEADILAKISQYLRHPNLIELGSVECYKIRWNDEEQKRWFIVLQYGGNSLRSYLGRLGMRKNKRGEEEFVYLNGHPMEIDDALDIAIQVTDGLRALHEFEESPGQHIIHRDIKPENILIDKNRAARLTDFGISKIVERMSKTISLAGTPPYLAPEYSLGRLTAASDIYSLGIVIYEMATGQFPFRLHEDRFYSTPTPPHEVNPQIPAAFSDVIMHSLAWNPDNKRAEEAERYQRAHDMLQDLRRCYGRLHPVPPQYEQLSKDDSQCHYYLDQETGQDVRIFLYDAEQPLQCLNRLDATVRLEQPHLAVPKQIFNAENSVGVVVPLPEMSNSMSSVEAQAETVTWHLGSGVTGEDEETSEPRTDPPTENSITALSKPLQSGEAYQFVKRILKLCEQLQGLHRLGIHHGFLTLQSVWWTGEFWFIDHVWLGPLIGWCDVKSVLGQTGVAAEYLAPEVLCWNSSPPLSSDIYGVGALLYGTLTGTPPLEPAAARAMVDGGPMPPFRAGSSIRDLAPTVARKLHRVIVKALQPEPANRHQSLDELSIELKKCRWPSDMVESLIEDAMDFQKQGKLVEAYDALDQALAVEPGHPAVHHARAEIYFLEGEFSWAMKENQKALDIEPDSSICFLHGQCLAAQDDLDQAMKFYRRGLRYEDCSRGRHLLARCLEQIGKHDEAVSEYEQAVEIAERIEKDPTKVEQIKSDLIALRSKLGPV